ncbi:MAG: PilZ domain-containing protein [Myxococcales bacterium]|nr:PilZ domain-containing protein [Myxococcales bacterium]
MQEATERRHPELTRVPLEDVLVALSPEGFDESFDADGVDVGIGGLSMRAAILPDIGSRLHCRFQSPHDGRCVDADAEVVWSRDAGPNSGEFGLRFTGLDPEGEDAIRSLVESWHEELGALAGDADREPSDHGFVRLRLEGVGQALEADVLHRAPDALVVQQGLPFLRIGTRVDEDGRAGVLEDVDLRLDGDTPKLVLTIAFDRPDAPAPRAPAKTASDPGDTMMDVPAPVDARSSSAEEPRIVLPAERGIAAKRSRLEEPEEAAREESRLARHVDREDVSFEAAGGRDSDDGEDDESYVANQAANEAVNEAADERDSDEGEDDESYVANEAAVGRASRTASGAAASRARARAEDAPRVVRASREDDESSEEPVAIAPWKAHAQTALAKTRGGLGAAWSWLAPRGRAAWARTRHAVGTWARRVGPFLKALASRIRREKPAAVETKTAAPRAARPTKRRTTALPGQREPHPTTPEPTATVAPRKRRGLAILGLLAILGGLVAWSARGDAEERPPEAPVVADALPAALPSTVDPEAGDDGTLVEEPTEPRVAERGGPIPEPSFPSLQNGARPSSPPGTVPSSSPYAGSGAAPPAASGNLFGDASASGTELRLRMDGVVSGLRGERTADGFRVVATGVRAVDGARRLAAMNPNVERASILNGVDGAELNVKFVGAPPAFSVRADGDAIVVVVAP